MEGKGHADVDTYETYITYNAFWIFVPIIILLSYIIRRFCCRKKEASQEIQISTVGAPYTGTNFNSSQPQYGGQFGMASQPQYGGQYGLGMASQPQTSNQNSYYSYSNPASASPGGFIQPPAYDQAVKQP